MPVPVWWNHGAGIDGHIVRAPRLVLRATAAQPMRIRTGDTDLILKELAKQALRMDAGTALAAHPRRGEDAAPQDEVGDLFAALLRLEG